MLRKKDLEKELDRINELLAQKGHNKQKTSTFFILLNSNESTQNQTQVESSREYMKEIVKTMGENTEKFVQFRDSSHKFTTEYVDNVNIKFALEQSRGRRKKDGTYSEHGGQVHAHVLMTVKHKSNISLDHQALQDLLQPEFNSYYGHNGFVGAPKWIPDSKVEDYMTKSKDYSGGHRWKEI